MIHIQWYHRAIEWPKVVVQGVQSVEPQRFESQVVEIAHVEEMKVVGFLVLVRVEFLCLDLDFLVRERKCVGLYQKELVQVLVLVWFQYLDFMVWSEIF